MGSSRSHNSAGLVRQPREPDFLKGALDEAIARASPAQAGVEGQVFGERERGLDGIERAEEMEPRRVRLGVVADRGRSPGKPAGMCAAEARHQAQQTRLAGAVRPQQRQRAPGLEAKFEPLEHAPPTAPAGESRGGERRRVGHGGQRREEENGGPATTRRPAFAQVTAGSRVMKSPAEERQGQWSCAMPASARPALSPAVVSPLAPEGGENKVFSPAFAPSPSGLTYMCGRRR